jgi:exopolysaccharide production protein ExoZ
VNNTKLDSIQFLRAIAVILVIYVHSFGEASSQKNFYYLSTWGAIGVDLFFTISGFIMAIVYERYAQQKDGAKVFMLKRAVRILPLYWLISLLVLIVQTINIPLSWSSLYKTVLIFPIFDKKSFIYPILPQGWTLAYELLFYGIISTFIYLKKFNILKGVIISLSALTLLGCIVKPTSIIGNFILSPFWMEFATGLLVGKWYHEFEKHPAKLSSSTLKTLSLMSLVVGACLMIATIFINTKLISMMECFANDYPTALKRVVIWGIPSALFVIGVTFSASIYKCRIPKLFVTIGNASFSCYLIHFYILRRINNYFTKLPLINADFQVIVFLLLIIASGIFVYRFIEKPIIKNVSTWLLR